MKALIVGSGCISDPTLLIDRAKWADLVIAADGGTESLIRAGLTPQVILGDFDSLPQSVLTKLENDPAIEILHFPVKKDYTDMELAIDLAAERGATEIVMLGGTGSRLDHTLANVMLLYPLLRKGIKGCLEDSHNRIYMTEETMTIKKQDNLKVSLLSLTPSVEGLTTKGLEYGLTDAELKFGQSLGVSNEFIGETAVISIKKGLLLVCLSKD